MTTQTMVLTLAVFLMAGSAQSGGYTQSGQAVVDKLEPVTLSVTGMT